MIVVDRLVHNLLARTGILARLGASHAYGPAATVTTAARIFCGVFRRRSTRGSSMPNFPANFPRYIQHALWRYCAADELNVCNGNNIDDRKSCEILLVYYLQYLRQNRLEITVIIEEFTHYNFY